MSTATTLPILSASSLIDNNVINPKGEDIGYIKEIMIDPPMGRIAYAVLSFGGFLGFGDKLFAVPFDLLRLDTEKEQFVLDVDKELLEQAEGFDKDNWPNFADPAFRSTIYKHYSINPYWN